MVNHFLVVDVLQNFVIRISKFLISLFLYNF